MSRDNTSLPLDIEFDMTNILIRVGDWSSEEILHRRKSENNFVLKQNVLEANGFDLPKLVFSGEKRAPTGESCKERHTYCNRVLGGRFNFRLANATFFHWVIPKKEIVNRYCFISNGWNHRIDVPQLRRLWKNLPLAEALFNDGLHNIAPLCLFFVAEPKQLKQVLGKGVWKKLCRNSLTTNKNIVERIVEHEGLQSHKRLGPVCETYHERYQHYLEAFTQVRPTLITRYRQFSKFNDEKTLLKNPDLAKWLDQHVAISKKTDVHEATTIFCDTQRMARQLNKRFNTQWSYKRLHKEHDQMSYLAACQSYSTTAIQWLNDRFLDEIVMHGVAIKVLKSPAQIAAEGIVMHHCVASYVPDVEEGKYLVLSLETPGMDTVKTEFKRTTLGLIYKPRNDTVKLDQHHGVFNQQVTLEQHLACAQALVQKNLSQLIKQDCNHSVHGIPMVRNKPSAVMNLEA